VNVAGRLPDYSLAFSKVAYWIRFSKWYMATGSRISKLNVGTREEDRRGEMYERVVVKEKLDQEAISYLEFGVQRGGSFFWWPTRCPDSRNRFVGFDTFLGLPEDWSQSSRKGKFSTDGQIPKTDDSRCRFEVGLFQSTLSGFLTRFNRNGTKLVLHLDADLYSSTLYVLTTLAPVLHPGDLLLFDEFASVLHEFRALDDFVRAFYLDYELIAANNNFEQVCLKVNEKAEPNVGQRGKVKAAVA
jgi:hypothetical protein